MMPTECRFTPPAGLRSGSSLIFTSPVGSGKLTSDEPDSSFAANPGILFPVSLPRNPAALSEAESFAGEVSVDSSWALAND
jgi:hypothetical protein